MLGFIGGKVLFSDGTESIIQTNSGLGYQVFFNGILSEGTEAGLYLSHVIREADETLYGFRTLREKKMFELLTTVKGVGPKSAYSLLSALGVDEIINAVLFDNKKSLSKAPGVGAKAAAQLILDLSSKIEKIKMFSNKNVTRVHLGDDSEVDAFEPTLDLEMDTSGTNVSGLLDDTLMACKELGFKEARIKEVATAILSNQDIKKSEQLIHLVLKEI